MRTLTQGSRRSCCRRGDRLERDALAACVAAPRARALLAEVSAGALRRRRCTGGFRDQLVDGGDDAELVALLAELDARAAREGIDEETAKQLLLRLRERRLRRELGAADADRLPDLQTGARGGPQAIREFA